MYMDEIIKIKHNKMLPFFCVVGVGGGESLKFGRFLTHITHTQPKKKGHINSFVLLNRWLKS